MGRLQKLSPTSIRLFMLCLLLVNGAYNIKVIGQIMRNHYTGDTGIKHIKIERSMVYQPKQVWMYAHHPFITKFKNKFYAIWSNGMINEDSPGQKVVLSQSSDFQHWSAPVTIANPGIYKSDTLNVLTAVGFHQFHDTLVVYYGEYSPTRSNTHLWAKTTTDGINWSEALDMRIPVNANQGPRALHNGRLIISGNFTFSYTDDYRGLSGWKMNSFYPLDQFKEDNPASFYSPAEKNNLPPLCEASFLQTGDQQIHALLRVTGKGWKGKLWQTTSSDNGLSWQKPVESGFTDNDSKFDLGQLPDGRFYHVGIPDNLHHYSRTPLVISLSEDGIDFNDQYLIADEYYQLQKEGLWKGGQYGYPITMIDNGYMYIIISRQKEAIEVLRFSLKEISKQKK
jgi:hypothetical protein